MLTCEKPKFPTQVFSIQRLCPFERSMPPPGQTLTGVGEAAFLLQESLLREGSNFAPWIRAVSVTKQRENGHFNDEKNNLIMHFWCFIVDKVFFHMAHLSS